MRRLRRDIGRAYFDGRSPPTGAPAASPVPTARIRPVSLRRLLRESTLYSIGNIAPKLGAFLLLPVYVRFLSQADYGALALLTSVAGVLGIVYHLGTDAALMRLHFDRSGRDQARLYSTVTIFSMAMAGGLTLLLTVAVGPFFQELFAGTPFIPLGLLALLLAAVGSITYVPSTLYRATGQAARFLRLNVGSFVISSTISVVLVTVFGFGAAGVLTGQLIATTGVMIVALVVVSRMGAWTFDGRTLRGALALGLPMLPHALSAWALRLADRWLIAVFIGVSALEARAQVGVYAVGYQLGYVVGIAITSFNAAWSPYFFRIGYRPSAPELYKQMTSVVIGGFLVIAVGVSSLAPEIVAVVARPGYEPAADVMPLIAFASIFQGLYVMFVTVVFLTKRTGPLAFITFSAATLNVGANALLIPRFGIMGAAWATLLAYAGFAAGTYLLARRQYPMRIDWARLVVLGLTAAASVLLARTLAPNASVTNAAAHAGVWIAYACVATAVCAAPVRRLRILSRDVGAEVPAAP